MRLRTDDAVRVREDIFADPDLPKDLRLFALAVVHLLETDDERRRLKEFHREAWAYRALRLMGHTGTTSELDAPLRWLIRDDVPKYRLPNTPITCVGTMLRPAGAPCTRKTTVQTTIPNPLTGEREWFGSCSRPIHRGDFDEQRKAAWQAWRDNGEPQPNPNSGGLLLRFFTSGMEPLYAWADKDYQRGDKVPEAPAQKLAIVTSIADRRRDQT